MISLSMKIYSVTIKIIHRQIMCCTALLFATAWSSRLTAGALPTSDLLDHEARLLASDEVVHLKKAYGGKVVLVENTASKCGYTDQYEGLEMLHETYGAVGLFVLGLPSNVFSGQEPGTEKHIQNFCRLTYGVKFPMFAKTSMKMGSADPIFAGLAESVGRYPEWNFHKHLIGRDGRLVNDYRDSTSPGSNSLVKAIEVPL